MGCASSASQQRRSPGQAVIASLRGELLRPIDALAQTPGKVLIVSGVLAPAGALPLCAPLSAAPSFYVGLCVKELVWYTHRTDETFGQGVVEDRERWEVRYSEVLTGHVVIQDPADSAVRVLVKIAPGKYSFDAVTKKTAVEVKSGQPHPPGFKKHFTAVNCEYSMGHWKYEEEYYPTGVLVDALGVAGVAEHEGVSTTALLPLERGSLSEEELDKYSSQVRTQWSHATRSSAVHLALDSTPSRR